MSELAKTIRLLRMWENELATNANGLEHMADNRIFCLKIKAREQFNEG